MPKPAQEPSYMSPNKTMNVADKQGKKLGVDIIGRSCFFPCQKNRGIKPTAFRLGILKT